MDNIEFSDFKQLEEYDEGYVVEYKSVFDKSVRGKLPKIIASFANASGGWLFIGIEDKQREGGGATHPICCIEESRTDYSETIAHIVERRITPLPRFEVRFVRDPSNTKQGVLVIEVQEGVEPPYVADGSIYVRVASSSDKYVAEANSYMLIDLQRKSRYFKDEFDRFCRRTVFFPPRTVFGNGLSEGLPIWNLYLKRLGVTSDEIIPIAKIDADSEDMLEAFKSCFPKETAFCQHSYRSLLIRREIDNCVDSASPVIELFRDGSMKLSVPLTLLQGDEREAALSRIAEIAPIRNERLAQLLDGCSTLYDVLQGCRTLDTYLDKKRLNLYDFAVSVEFENAQGAMIYSDRDSYFDYIGKHGIPFIGTVDDRTEPRIFHRGSGEPPLTACEYGAFNFQEAYGLPLVTKDELANPSLISVLLDGLPEEISDAEEREVPNK